MISPVTAIERLKEGNRRFTSGKIAPRDLSRQVERTSAEQRPYACILSCMDSRTGPELLFDAGLGELFSIRIAGNVLNKEILGSLEFAAAEAGISLIFVMGHTRCAAISGAWSNMQLGHFTSLLNDIRPALDAAGKMEAAQDQEHFLDRASELHVKLTLDRIRKESRILTDLEKQGRLEICGGCYDVKTGKVRFL